MAAYDEGRAAMRTIADSDPDSLPAVSDPGDAQFARGFIDELCHQQDQQKRLFRGVVRGTRRQAADVQVAPLDSLLEIIQNADDAGARTLEIDHRASSTLVMRHDGRPLTCQDVVGIVLPTITTKGDDPDAIGRFGIGLKTVFALANAIAVRDDRYAVMMTLDGAEPSVPLGSQATEIELRLHEDLASNHLRDWLDDLGGDGLIFTRNLEKLVLRTPDDDLTIRLRRSGLREVRLEDIDGDGFAERVGFWSVYRAIITPPPEMNRDRKARRETVTVSVAIGPTNARGRLCIGLPTGHRWRAPISFDAPFDPDASRRTVKEQPWNEWLFQSLAQLLKSVVALRWSDRPPSVWCAVPCPGEMASPDRPWMQQQLDRIADDAQQRLLELSTPGEGQWLLSELVWPSSVAEEVMDDESLASVSRFGPLEKGWRDGSGRWRDVMSAIDPDGEVGLDELVELTKDPSLRRPAQWYLALANTLLRQAPEMLEEAVVLVDRGGGRHSVREAREGVVLVPGPVRHHLPVVRQIHSVFRSAGASDLRGWLAEQGVLLDEVDDSRILRAIAGHPPQDGISIDREDLLWLRAALQVEAKGDLETLGPSIGRVTLLDGYRFTADGRREPIRARPSEMYLPAAIDRSSATFAKAAGKTPGLCWADPSYAELLKADDVGGGDALPAASRFLQLLGASSVPRLVEPAPTTWDADDREARGTLQFSTRQELAATVRRRVGAQGIIDIEVIDDRDSPDLVRAATDLAAHRGDDVAERAEAMLALLRRAWTHRVQPWREHASCRGRFFYRTRLTLRDEERVPSRWVSRLAEVPWLVTASGDRVAPRSASVRTHEVELVDGESPHHVTLVDEDEDVLDLLSALGARLTAETSEIVRRLRELRELPVDRAVQRTAQRCYAILASRVPDPPEPAAMVGDVSVSSLQGSFGLNPAHGGLVLTSGRWLSPASVVLGGHGFGRWRAALPDEAATSPLWRALNVVPESPRVAKKVIQDMASEAGEPDRGVLVRALRILASAAEERPAVKDLPLWCGDRWVTERPVFACEHPELRVALAETVPVWEPFCDLATLGGLVSDADVRLVNVRASDEIRLSYEALPDTGLTEHVRRALRHFRADIERHAPGLQQQQVVPWSILEQVVVGRADEIVCTVDLDGQEVELRLSSCFDGRGITLTDHAAADLDDPATAQALLAWWYVPGDEHITSLYTAALYWGQAWRRSIDAVEPTWTVLEETHPDALPTDDGGFVLPASVLVRTPDGNGGRGSAASADPERGARLKTAISLGRVEREEGGPPQPSSPGGRPRTGPRISLQEAPEPDRRQAPNGRGPTSVEVEDAGWRIIEALLAEEDAPIRDLRARRDVGADGYDPRRDKAVELKAYQGATPDVIRLQRSQIEEARERGADYWLFVVSGLSEGEKTEVRLIRDPVRALAVAPQPSVRFQGVRSAADLVWSEMDDGGVLAETTPVIVIADSD